MNSRIRVECLALVVSAFSLGSTGCALPVIEGVFDQRDFALFDDTPEARGEAGDEVLLVFLDVDRTAGQLRTVSIDLRALPGLPTGEELTVGTGDWDDERPSIEVVEGSLLEEPLDDGGVLMTTGDDARRAASVEGSILLDQNDATVAGRFRVDLDDGGYLNGSFRSTRE
jgi:hypothetical protein